MKNLILLSTLLLFAVVMQGVVYNHVSDDAFISFRYAHNLAVGNGLVFNTGEKVEGFSNLLWILILYSIEQVGLASGPLGLLVPAKLIGMLCGLASIGYAYKVGKLIGKGFGIKSEYFPFLAPAVLASSLPFHFWAVSGLETPLVVLAVLLFISASYKAYFHDCVSHRDTGVSEREAGSKWLPPVWLLVISLLRPEGPIFLLPLVYVAYRKDGPWTMSLRPIALGFIVPYLLLVGGRIFYYGELLPNIFYTKTTGGWIQLLVGAKYFITAAKNIGPGVFALALCSLLFWPLKKLHVFILSTACVYILFVLVVGGDFMVMSRFFVHILPPLVLLAALGIAGLVDLDSLNSRMKAGSVARLILAKVLILALVLPPILSYYKELVKHGRQWTAPLSEFAAPYDEVMGYINARTVKEPLVAVEQLGYFGYYSKWRLIDLHGLIDKAISRRPGRLHSKIDIDYVVSRRPDYIVTNSGGPGARIESNFYNRRFLGNPDFLKNYQQVLLNDWFVMFAAVQSTVDLPR